MRSSPRPAAADLVIRGLAESEAALIDEARDLAADVQAYREACHAALAEAARSRRPVPAELM